MSPVHLFDAISLAMVLPSAALFGTAALLWLWSLMGPAKLGPVRQTMRNLASYAALFLTLSLFAGAYAWAGQ